LQAYAQTTSSVASPPPATSLAEGIAFTGDENIILSAVRDHSQQLDEQGLFVLLSQAAELPQLSRLDFDKLAQAEISQLLGTPEVFRGRPMRLRLRVFQAEKWTPGMEIGKSPRWASGKPVWYLTGLASVGDAQPGLPVIVLSAVDPSPVLGRPDRMGGGGEMLYPSGRSIELAGLFYKVFAGLSIDQQRASSLSQPAAMSEYPVIVCWQIMPPEPVISEESKEIAGIVIAGLALLAGYIYVRRRVGTMRRASR
jgi:hypothetical protein